METAQNLLLCIFGIECGMYRIRSSGTTYKRRIKPVNFIVERSTKPILGEVTDAIIAKCVSLPADLLGLSPAHGFGALKKFQSKLLDRVMVSVWAPSKTIESTCMYLDLNGIKESQSKLQLRRTSFPLVTVSVFFSANCSLIFYLFICRSCFREWSH